MNEYIASYNKIIDRLKSTRRKETYLFFSNGLFKTIFFSICILIISSAIELVANGDEIFRGILALLSILSVLTIAYYNLSPSILRALGKKNKPTVHNIALRVGKVYPDIKDDLCNTIQLVSKIQTPRGTSPALALAAFENVYTNAQTKDFDEILDKKDIKKWLLFLLLGIFFGIISFGVFNSSLGASLYRLINWNQSFLPPAPFSLYVEPVNKNVLRTESIKITVRASGKAPQTVTLYIKEKQQENYDKYTLKLDSGNLYSYHIQSIKNTITFYAESMWLNRAIRSNDGIIEVIDKPLVRTINGKINYPYYTKLAPKSFDEKNADVAALKGSNLEFNLISNKDLSKAEIVFINTKDHLKNTIDSAIISQDTFKYQMRVNNKIATGGFKIQKSGIYYFNLYDKDYQNNDEPVKYQIVALNDEYPTINLLEPSYDVKLSEEAILPMKIAISDDYGFSSLKLYYRRIESQFTVPSEKFSSINISFSNQENTAEIPYLWDLNPAGISPEDVFEYYLEVFDNDIVTGPKSAKSNILRLKLPSLDEVLDNANQEQTKIENDLEKVLKKAEEVQKDMEELNKELLKNPTKKDLNWKEKKKAEELLKKQDEIKEKLSELQEQLNDVTQQLQENNAISQETMQKYMELQKLMKEVNSPELRQMQERMQQALDKLSQDELQKALKNIQFNEEQFRKSIERTLNILKRLKAEQKVDALTKRAEELIKKQNELENKMDNTNPSDKDKRQDLANEQKTLQKELKDINDELKDLENLMKEIGKDMPLDELSKAEQELNQQETSQEMQNSSNSCNSGDFNKAKSSQQKAKQNLKKFSEQMKKVKQKMEDKVTKEVMKKMEKSINDLLELSDKQENLKSKTQSADYNSTQFNELAQQQYQMFEGLANIANGLMELSQKTFAVTPEMGQNIGNALKDMQQSIQNLSNRQTNAASKNQESSMSSMNKAISNMQSMLSMMQSQQSSGSCPNPGGMGEGQNGNQQGSYGDRMQQLALQQQAINQSIQKQMQSGGSLSQEQQAQIERISKDQGNAKKTLEELADEQKANSSATGKKLALGDLDKIAKEMQETISDLKNNNITPETMKRQDRILSRLLDASKSLNERDFEKTREARTGKDVIRNSPNNIDLRTQEGKSKAFQDFLQSIQQGYTKDYEVLIRQYFEMIQKQGKQ